jgi:hypothetical protein
MADHQKGDVEIRVARVGPTGKPYAEILTDQSIDVAHLGTIIEKVTRDKDLRDKLGLGACGACKSGFDFNLRDRFEEVIKFNLKDLGIRNVEKGAA